MTDKVLPSIKFKMLMDAGYHMPDPWDAYILLVDFVKEIANQDSDDNEMFNIFSIQAEARKLLEKIGEY